MLDSGPSAAGPLSFMQLINLMTSPVHVITADKSRRKEMNTRHLYLSGGMRVSHMSHVQMIVCVYVCVCVCTCFLRRKHLLQGVRSHLSDSVLQPLTDPPAELIHCLDRLRLQRGAQRGQSSCLIGPSHGGFTLFDQMNGWCVEHGGSGKPAVLSAG